MKYTKLCLLAFAIVIFCCVGRLSAQSNCSYVVVSTGTYTLSQIDQALGSAKLDSYRKQTLRRVLLFTNGAEIQLLSASELQSSNCPVNGTLAMDDSQPLDPNRRFEIHPSGVIMETTTAIYKN